MHSFFSESAATRPERESNIYFGYDKSGVMHDPKNTRKQTLQRREQAQLLLINGIERCLQTGRKISKELELKKAREIRPGIRWHCSTRTYRGGKRIQSEKINWWKKKRRNGEQSQLVSIFVSEICVRNKN